MSFGPGAPREVSGRLVRSWFLAGLVVFVGVCAYRNSFSGPFVLDDFSSIQENTSIRHLWPLGAVLSPPENAGIGGRPFANLTFALNYALSGLDVWSYHATNLLLHLASALVLFGIVRRMLRLPSLRARFGAVAHSTAFMAALAWVAHPLTTSTVDYASQRTEALMAACYLLTVYAFIRAVDGTGARSDGAAVGDGATARGTPSRVPWLSVSIAMCAVGTASKEVIVTAPAVVLLLDRFFVSADWREVWRRHGRFHLALAGTWLLLGWLMLRAPVTDRGVGFGLGVTPLHYVLTEARALTVYAQLAVWPEPLVFDRGWDFLTGFVAALPYLVCCAAAAAALAALLWRSPRSGIVALIGLVILAPTTLVPIVHQPIAESRAYLPLAVACALGALGAVAALGRRAWLVAMLAAAAFVLLTVQRNKDYADAVRLWSDTVAKGPANARAQNNLAVVLIPAGRAEEAVAHASTALTLQPNYVDAYITRAAAYAALGRLRDTVSNYEQALRLEPGNPTAHANLGNALVALGESAAARSHLETALRLKPDLARTHNDLGVVLLDAGDIPGAIAHDQAALRLDPQMADAHYNLGNAVAAAGHPTDAIAEYQAALALKPAFDKAENNLGAVLLKLGRPAEARPHFVAALRINPDNRSARQNLAVAEAALRRP